MPRGMRRGIPTEVTVEDVTKSIGRPCARNFDGGEVPRQFDPGMSPYCGSFFRTPHLHKDTLVYYDEEKQHSYLRHVLLVAPGIRKQKIATNVLVVTIGVHARRITDHPFLVHAPVVHFGLNSKYNKTLPPPEKLPKDPVHCTRVALYEAFPLVSQLLDEDRASIDTLIIATNCEELVQIFAWGGESVYNYTRSPGRTQICPVRPREEDINGRWIDFEEVYNVRVQLWYEPASSGAQGASSSKQAAGGEA